MPPKKTFEKKEIIAAALQIIRENGSCELSTRKTAEILKTSVAPIYTYYASVEDLKRDAMLEIGNQLLAYTAKNYTDKKSLNCGIGFVLFARDNPAYYRQLFLTNAEYKNVIDRLLHNLKQTIFNDLRKWDLKKSVQDKIADTLWIFAYGLAGLACVGLLEPTDEQSIINKLSAIAKTEITAEIQRGV